MSILVVDDDRQLVSALLEVLEDLRLEARAATDGQSALALLREGYRPSVVVMDLVMPNTGGIELFAEMLADPELRTIPVITMSGLKMDMHLPSRVHLEKPFSSAALMEAIQKATGRAIAEPPEPRTSRGH